MKVVFSHAEEIIAQLQPILCDDYKDVLWYENSQGAKLLYMFDSNFWAINTEDKTITIMKKDQTRITTRAKHDYMLWTYIDISLPDINISPYIYKSSREVKAIYHVPIDNECIRNSIQYTIIRRIMSDCNAITEGLEQYDLDKHQVDFLVDYTKKVLPLLQNDNIYIMPMYFKMFNNGCFDKKAYENQTLVKFNF